MKVHTCIAKRKLTDSSGYVLTHRYLRELHERCKHNDKFAATACNLILYGKIILTGSYNT